MHRRPGRGRAAAAEGGIDRGAGGAETARVMALVNVAMMDANIATWDAKYAYWSIPPSHADSSIALALPLPNFPSYPAGQPVLVASAATALQRLFPEEREPLETMIREAAWSRVIAGLHDRFDVDAGVELGRAVALRVLDRFQREGAGALLPREGSASAAGERSP